MTAASIVNDYAIIAVPYARSISFPNENIMFEILLVMQSASEFPAVLLINGNPAIRFVRFGGNAVINVGYITILLIVVKK